MSTANEQNTFTLPQAVEFALGLLGNNDDAVHAGGVVIGERNCVANLRWANSDLTTNGDTVDESLSVAAFVHTPDGIGAGIASGQFVTESDIRALVALAQSSAIAGGASEDAARLFAGPTEDSFMESPATLDTRGLTSLAASLGKLFGTDGVEFFGYAEQSVDTLYLATSSGTRLRFAQSTSRFELCGKSHERTRSAWSGHSGSDLGEVDVSLHAGEVLSGLAHQANQIEIDPGPQQVILTPSAASDLMIYLLWSASAREAAEGRSVFSGHPSGTRIGERLATELLNITSDPKLAGLETLDRVVALGSSSLSSTFDNGLPIERVELIKDGVLNALGSSRHAASEAQLPFTPLAENIEVEVSGRSGTLDELAARVGDGLLITCLWYIREVDAQSLLLTGLTRDGVYVVRDGKIIGCTSNFRFNESPVGMLDRVVDAGSAIRCLPREWGDYFARARVAPLAIRDFNLSTKSDAI